MTSPDAPTPPSAESPESLAPPRTSTQVLARKPTLLGRLGRLLIGRARNPNDESLFHTLSLIAFFAWVGLGADGLSSLCYGPEEAFLNLHGHFHLGIFVAIASVLTVLVISAGYSQLIEAFPSGGGGYLVASKMLSPSLGTVCGCALLVDYILTITISVASSAEFIFSFLPADYQWLRIYAAILGLILLTLLNLRGVKESVLPLVPVFLLFIFTHALAIVWALAMHASSFPDIVHETADDIRRSAENPAIGVFGMIVLVLKSYSTGAGTYTGIEAVSNGLQILREPRVKTGKRTMRYMAISLAVGVMGLLVAYLLMRIDPQMMYDDAGVKVKTLNALLFEKVSEHWGFAGKIFVWSALASSAAILLVAAQAGFLGGPRVAANMAMDSWMPKRFAALSDRFVSHNGVMLMGGTALLTLALTRGSVELLVVLYAINVFITFVLSQAGMVRYWWIKRQENESWRRGMFINGVGLALCSMILVTLVCMKFREGGWVTLAVTCAIVAATFGIRSHYQYTAQVLRRLDGLVRVAEPTQPAGQPTPPVPEPAFDKEAKTAVVLVNGFSGVGLHTLFSVVRLFGGVFKNFVFIQVGAIDAGTFKGADEIQSLKASVAGDVERYVVFMKRNGFHAEGLSAIGVDIVQEATNLAGEVLEKFPQAVFFGGQLVFPTDSFVTRFLHNYTVFALQRRFYLHGIPFVVLPIRVDTGPSGA